MTLTVVRTVILRSTPSSSSRDPGRVHFATGSLRVPFAVSACVAFVAYPKPASSRPRLVVSVSGSTIGGTMRNTLSPAPAHKTTASLPGRHLTVSTASSSPMLALQSCLPVLASQIRTVPSSPPVANQSPEGSIAALRTRLS